VPQQKEKIVFLLHMWFDNLEILRKRIEIRRQAAYRYGSGEL
jgi:hypothetical protein